MTRTFRLAAAVALSAILASPFVSAQPAPQSTDLTTLFRSHGVVAQGLRVTDVGGILVIRGRAADSSQAAGAGAIARSLGYTRVANLIRVATPADDAKIERMAERELAVHRSLDGCHFSVASEDGIVRLAGKVTHELQKDVAIALVRNVDGVRAVHAHLQR
jgi:osmotically-inducible protein OsmY